MKHTLLNDVLVELMKQSKVKFLYNSNLIKDTRVDVKVEGEELTTVLSRLLPPLGLEYFLNEEVIVIREKPARSPAAVVPQSLFLVEGQVLDPHEIPLPGVTVRVDSTSTGTITGIDGKFSLRLPFKRGHLVFSFVGFKSTRVAFEAGKALVIVMEEEVATLADVVVTGIFERKAESFTGSVASYRGEELKQVGTRDVLQSLKSLDPSFRITPDNLFGSDPNRLPDINIRGKSSISNVASEWGDDPNRPIFILDGFEVDLQTIVDLSMDRVASLHILKDAASTAMYGSRAANGVVVIETKKPQAGSLKFSYNGSATIDMPDLSDYNMMNAEEKLAFEKASGFYERSGITHERLQWEAIYNRRLAAVREGGVDSYWLSEPLRVGITHKHNARVTGGDKSMYYSFSLYYNGTEGVMKQSNRDIVGTNINLQYQRENLRLSNDFTLDHSVGNNPPISFNEYVRVNPYYKKEIHPDHPEDLDIYSIYAENGAYTTYHIVNPLYNASLKHVNRSTSTGFRDNFRAEYTPFNGLKISGKVNLSFNQGKTENFVSPYHTSFANRVKTERGSYTKSSSQHLSWNGDLAVIFGKVYDDVHQVNVVGRVETNSQTRAGDTYMAIGFPSDRVANPAFAVSYPDGGKPGYNENFKRAVNMMVTANYGYKGRYLVDITARRDGSSNFGVNNLWTNTWSAGLAWNVHNEPFIGDWAKMLKLRVAYGNPGNNNQAFDTFLVYSYNTNHQNLFGLGAHVLSYGNVDLDWQKTNDFTLGLDLALLDGRVSAVFDYYRKVTDPLIIEIGMAPSTGKASLVANLGRNTITGLTFKIDTRVIDDRERDLRWNINAHGYHETSEFSRIGNSLDRFNNELRNTSIHRYRDGASASDIWTVPSAGIDPMTGQEIFIKKDGTYTFTYNVSDEVVCGNTLADLEGVIGTTFYYRGLTLSAHFRYSFGGDHFNNELYNRIENIGDQTDRYNQDKRAYYDRWKQPGDIARYRDIRLRGITNPKSSRYIQKNNYLSGESISAGYTFYGRTWLAARGIDNIILNATLNDIFRYSTVKAERGINYPFARAVSLSMNITF
jgi:TonB-linked SusC/RagA family outer membrane protein